MADMTFRHLGSSGLVVSTVGLGCNNFGRRLDLDATREVVHAALDSGITLFDTADSYGDSEEMLGRVLADRREEVVLATKFGSDVGGANGPDWGARGSRRYIRRAVERSLRRLGREWIDLYQHHRPDPTTPVEETLSALTELVREGKVRYLGCSNYAAWQVAHADWIARTHGHERFVSAQNEYSLLNRKVEKELVPACTQFGIGVLPYFPLANGMLTGKYHRGEPVPAGSRVEAWGIESYLSEARFDAVEELTRFADDRSLTLVEVAVGALAAQPGVASVIAGATSAQQVNANAGALRWSPGTEDLAAIDAIVGRARVIR